MTQERTRPLARQTGLRTMRLLAGPRAGQPGRDQKIDARSDQRERLRKAIQPAAAVNAPTSATTIQKPWVR